jgi:phage tail sheath protein FI
MYDYAAMYYPWALGTNVDGKEIVIPSSTVAIRAIGFNDNIAYPWFPPAGSRRGVITNASSVGYVDLATRNYVSVTLNPGQRDTLYNNKINPLAFIPGRGLLVYGDKTLSPNDGSALSRVNVARLVVYLRTVLPNALVPFLFELNTDRTRAAARSVVTSILVDLLGKEGISDFLVVADSSNNTPDVIDRNELVIDVLVAPTKSINFILVPVRIRRTGSV